VCQCFSWLRSGRAACLLDLQCELGVVVCSEQVNGHLGVDVWASVGQVVQFWTPEALSLCQSIDFIYFVSVLVGCLPCLGSAVIGVARGQQCVSFGEYRKCRRYYVSAGHAWCAWHKMCVGMRRRGLGRDLQSGNKLCGCLWRLPGFCGLLQLGKRGCKETTPNVSAAFCSLDSNIKGTSSCIVVRRSGLGRQAGSLQGATAAGSLQGANKAELQVKSGQFGHKDRPVALVENCQHERPSSRANSWSWTLRHPANL